MLLVQFDLWALLIAFAQLQEHGRINCELCFMIKTFISHTHIERHKCQTFKCVLLREVCAIEISYYPEVVDSNPQSAGTPHPTSLIWWWISLITDSWAATVNISVAESECRLYITHSWNSAFYPRLLWMFEQVSFVMNIRSGNQSNQGWVVIYFNFI